MGIVKRLHLLGAIAAALLVPAWLAAATLTVGQLVTLKTAIAADPALNGFPHTPDGAFDCSQALQVQASPTYLVWRTSVSMFAVVSMPGFDWTRVDNLSTGHARIMDWMRDLPQIDPSKASVRNGIEAAFPTESTDAPCRQAFYDAASRPASKSEKLFASGGTGASPTSHGVGPATMGVITDLNPVTQQNVLDAWAS